MNGLRILGALAAILGLAACATGTPAEGRVCGDGVRFGAEQCDDGNLDTGDGCNAACEVEEGWSCELPGDFYCAPICGDGLLLGGETCDGTDVGGATCEDLELGVGEVVCSDDCQLDTSGCQDAPCGNEQLDPGEDCDGQLLDGETCESQGYDGGSLACTAACTLDTAGCTLSSCGNGIVEGVEDCDDGNLNPGDGCSGNCSIEPGWACVGQPSVCARLCGNLVLDAGEDCDGVDLGGQTCTSLGLGYVGGTLGCSPLCTYDTSGCDLPSCGNGALDTGEQCDGVLLGNATCESVGSYIGGTLQCSPSCAYDVSLCVPIVCGDGVISAGEQCDDNNQQSGDGCNVACNVEAGWECTTTSPSVCTPLCGNNQLDPNEDCDGGQLGGATCQSLGYDTGSLACDPSCNYDTSSCSMFSCGDGQVTGLEECDGTNLNGQTCQSLGYISGGLSCTGTCAFDTGGCVAPSCGDGITTTSAGEQCDDGNLTTGDGCNAACQVENGYVCDTTQQPSVCTLSCGNGNLDPGEDCDGSLLGGGTCQTLGFPGGTLACDNCSYDTSGCLTEVCPNGVREGGEECDGSDFGGQSCSDFGFTGGNLICTSGCTIDTSSCSNCPATLASVFSADFSSPSSTSWANGTDVPVGSSIWNAYTITYHGVRIDGGELEITNKRGSSGPSHGQGYAYVKTGGAASDYNNAWYDSTLANNAGLEVVWTLNLQRNDPEYHDGGFSCSSTSSQNRITLGLAYVLAGSSAAGLNASTSTCGPSATAFGYAVVMGGSGGSVRLVRFVDGLRNGTLTDIVASNGWDADVYHSVRVTYNADTHQWRLEARSDGYSSFSDPASGSYSFDGTGSDSTYVNFALDYAGPYFQTGCCCLCSEVYTAKFDNVSVGVRCAP